MNCSKETKKEDKQRKQILRKRHFNRTNPKWQEERRRKSLQRKRDILRGEKEQWENNEGDKVNE